MASRQVTRRLRRPWPMPNGLGKSPIVINDGPGIPGQPAIASLHERSAGADRWRVQRSRRLNGPPRSLACRWGRSLCTTWLDLDTALYAGPDDVGSVSRSDSGITDFAGALVKAGRLGQKSGTWLSSRIRTRRNVPSPIAELAKYVEPYMKSEPRSFDSEAKSKRACFLPMLLEATRVLQEKLVRDVRDVDLGLIFGIGFPPFKGGLLTLGRHPRRRGDCSAAQAT